ncbi:hypothetical protein Q0590_36110 [Rhodocytophaga aerolata]|uniref:DUF5673 domain-containing protein n=1 Tax=Rhodocytophaga aerolata TaxID=455078 RepID=A0ABT8RI44_9BACT|nr:hypothetical protein [Rhodocytophaga aerolata]MDO1451755.1 hypothetical protein [Rhodocytophaga aerolata]
MKEDIERLNRKIWLLRMVFILLILTSCLLLVYQQTDYVILLLLVVITIGFITLDRVQVEYDKLDITKYYLFGYINKHYKIQIADIDYIYTVNSEIDPYNESWMYTEEIFSGILIDSFRPKYKRVLHKVVYKEKGKEKTLRINLSKEDHKEIDKKMRKFKTSYC